MEIAGRYRDLALEIDVLPTQAIAAVRSLLSRPQCRRAAIGAHTGRVGENAEQRPDLNDGCRTPAIIGYFRVSDFTIKARLNPWESALKIRAIGSFGAWGAAPGLTTTVIETPAAVDVEGIGYT